VVVNVTAADDDDYWHPPRPVQWLKSVTYRFDELPISLAGSAEWLLTAVRLRQDRLAAGDPVWANLERRRRAATDEDGNVTISDDFDLRDYYEADRIARSITPDPRWLPAVNRVVRLQTWHLALALERRCQKRKLGWDESQTINAHRHLCRIVGQLLLAYDQLGWTLPNDYPSSASWHAELTRHAHSLTSFGTLEGGHRHYRAPDQYEAACEALRWVADHLNDLSD